MAGRATELLVFGESEITQICQQDFIEAKKIAYKMVVKYGFSNLGPLSFDSKKIFVNPTINSILTIGIDRLSDPLALVISAMVAPIAVKSVNKNIK